MAWRLFSLVFVSGFEYLVVSFSAYLRYVFAHSYFSRAEEPLHAEHVN